MFAAARRLLQPKGIVRSVSENGTFAVLQFEEASGRQSAILFAREALPSLPGRDVAFEVEASDKPGKTNACGLRLCDAAEATGTIKFYDVIKGFGVVVGKDQKESFIHHSQITDIGPLPPS
eukprot:TRINITY_DN2842_c0_g1_i1.p1 TRINITY_DN2842_c0_g1~~TRINITY_DN2842_c0_g1_i1.p1  ORF type:complete len:128 (-),score=29.28 TRINITY_DN2842_c0_g1_i1:200-562(-)